MRLDVALVQRGFFQSREKAKYAVEQKTVALNGKVCTKTSTPVAATDEINIVDIALPYVSIGGLKLEKAIKDFNLDFHQKTVLDIGASTGGFTDCALQFGATKVFAIDVGSNQLHPSLQGRIEVISIEHQNVKALTLAQLDHKLIDIIVMDVSFTSQIPLFPYLGQFLQPRGWFISLIKPQFEMETHLRFKGGVIKDAKIHQRIIDRVTAAAKEHHFHLRQLTEAPYQEGKNVEYLAWFEYIS